MYRSDRAPGAAVGLSADGVTLVAVVADGRSASSVGENFDGMGERMASLGAWQATFLDGGACVKPRTADADPAGTGAATDTDAPGDGGGHTDGAPRRARRPEARSTRWAAPAPRPARTSAARPSARSRRCSRAGA